MSAAERFDEQDDELFYLGRLAAELRMAIRECLMSGRPQFAVALDTARDFAEAVLVESHPKSTRIGVARARAEIALEVWREARDVRH
ncbi:MAG TPA: hypothetical protein VGH63_00665 [Polyangia bacterium]